MTEKRNCNMCLACDDVVAAFVFCKQCKQYFCTDCENEHIVTPLSEKHTFVSVEEGVSLEKPMSCNICEKLKKISKALKRCIECKLLLCDRCCRKHSASPMTSTHRQVEDLSVHTEKEVKRTSDNEGASLSVSEGFCQDLESQVSCSGIKVETEYYIRFVLLLIKGGSRVLRNILSWCLENKKINLEHFLTLHRVLLIRSKYLTRQQMENLYPDPPMTSDTHRWDIQLLCFIILQFFSKQLNSPQLAAVKKIREMRNDFYAHHTNACIDRQTFFELITELSLIMNTMGENMIESEREENDKLIGYLCSSKLDMNSATEEIRKLGNTDEFYGNIQECLNGVLDMHLHFVKQELADIKAALIRIEGEKYTKIVNTVYGAVHVYAREKSIVDKAEAELLEASNQCVSGTDETANSDLAKNFNNFKREVEESGNKLTKSDRGSIIFSFESHSASELLKLIDFFESKRMQTHMDNITQSLQNIIGESLTLTAYLLRDSLFEVLRRMQCQDHKKAIWFDMKCTGIEGLQHALKMFEEGGSSNSLNKMSEILTKSIGETITLETAIDVEQLQHAIMIMKEQLALPSRNKRALLMRQFSEDRFENGETNQETRKLGNEERSIFRERNESYISSRSKSYPEMEKKTKEICEKIENDRPGKPEPLEISSDTVSITWQPPSKFGKEDNYQVYYTTDLESKKRKWRKCQAEPNYHSITLNELKTDTTYIFRVKAVYGDEEGPYSPESDRITTPKSLALRLLQYAEKIGDNKQIPEKFMLPMTEISLARNKMNKTKKYEIGVAAKGYVKSKTILLVGATGTGKSTLVDGIANYALGVNWEDPFRFSVLNLEEHEKKRSENQAISQTDWITCYTINHEAGSRLKYQLNVIDTPGFGDTAGPNRDQEIASQLRKLFKEEKEPKGVTYIDAACFLIKSSDSRLTVFQEYIFKSVMALFGKDMQSNICYFITFADNRNPPVLAAMSELGLPKGENFIFNNSGLFETNISKDATNAASLFWKMGLQSFSLFFEYLEGLQSKSLQQTREVLEQRYKLEETVSQLQPLLDLGLSKVCSLKQEIEILEDNFSKIKDNKHFEYEVEEMKKERRELPSGVRSNHCLECGFTCHEKCINEQDLKFSCCAFDSDGYCKKCPNQCHWKKHESTTYKLDYVQVKVKKEYENMRQKFEEASGKVLTQEQVIDRLGGELTQTSKDMEYLMFVVKSCTDKLSAIALRPNPLNMIDYIDLIIENEKYDRKEGYQKRIKALKEFRKKAEIQQEFEKFNEQATGLLNTIGQSRAGLFVSAYKRAKSFLS